MVADQVFSIKYFRAAVVNLAYTLYNIYKMGTGQNCTKENFHKDYFARVTVLHESNKTEKNVLKKEIKDKKKLPTEGKG